MIQNNFSSALDQDAERKRALAKVYSILLRIADEHEAVKANQNEEIKSEPLQENIPPTEV